MTDTAPGDPEASDMSPLSWAGSLPRCAACRI